MQLYRSHLQAILGCMLESFTASHKPKYGNVPVGLCWDVFLAKNRCVKIAMFEVR